MTPGGEPGKERITVLTEAYASARRPCGMISGLII